MIDQKSVIDLAIQSGVIDSADINSIHIPQAYIDDLSHFADLAMQVERSEIIKALELYHAKLVEIGAGTNEILRLIIARQMLGDAANG